MSYTKHSLECNSSNYSATWCTKTYLVFHYTANFVSSSKGLAKANATYYHNTANIGASAHVFVDDEEVWESINYNYRAWAVGGSAYNTSIGGAKYHNIATNTNSISIEMCNYATGTKDNATYHLSEATLANARALGKEIIKKYGITKDHVICHFDVTGKACPMVDGWWGKNRSEWEKFRDSLFEEDDEDMTDKQFAEKMETYRKNLGEKDFSKWAKTAGVDKWCKETGIMDGTRPQDLCTRQEVAAMIKKAKEG